MSAQTLSCRELIDFLAAYLDAELPPTDHACFEVHLAACPDCVAYVVSYRETIRLGKLAFAADSELAAEVPAELIEAILAARPRR